MVRGCRDRGLPQTRLSTALLNWAPPMLVRRLNARDWKNYLLHLFRWKRCFKTSWCPRICPSCCCYSLDAITKSLLVLFDTSSCGGPLHLLHVWRILSPSERLYSTRVAFLLRLLITHIHCLNWYPANVHNSLWSLILSEGSQGWIFNTCTLT